VLTVTSGRVDRNETECSVYAGDALITEPDSGGGGDGVVEPDDDREFAAGGEQ